jgi:pimeloyl-ACP methyl ester carboxylesterase
MPEENKQRKTHEVIPDRSGYLNVPEDSARIYWEYFGAGDKEVLVLLNGLAMSTRAWYRSLCIVQPDYDVLLYDYLGQGKSTCDDVPYLIPRFCDYLASIMDALSIDKVHTMGVSYGGFIGADFGRLYPHRLHTQTLSGILLSHEVSFQMYQDLSLRFYQGGADAFDIYTQYLYEKIFGEAFLRAVGPKLEKMRASFVKSYEDRVFCLVRLTEAQNPFFAELDQNLAGYRACRVPTLIIAGGHDRAIPPWMQRKMCAIYPVHKLLVFEGSGHMTYMEYPELFWSALKRTMAAKSVDW